MQIEGSFLEIRRNSDGKVDLHEVSKVEYENMVCHLNSDDDRKVEDHEVEDDERNLIDMTWFRNKSLFSQDNSQKIIKLNLEQNNIHVYEEIPGFDLMTNLVDINLHKNFIRKMLDFTKFPNLISLDLSYNHIQKVEGLNGLQKLKHLYLQNNYISNVFDCADIKN